MGYLHGKNKDSLVQVDVFAWNEIFWLGSELFYWIQCSHSTLVPLAIGTGSAISFRLPTFHLLCIWVGCPKEQGHEQSHFKLLILRPEGLQKRYETYSNLVTYLADMEFADHQSCMYWVKRYDGPCVSSSSSMQNYSLPTYDCWEIIKI